MSQMNRREALVATLAGAAALTASTAARAEKTDGVGPAKLIEVMESYRKKMPPAQGLGEENGLSFKGIEPFTESHLAGVARRLGIKSEAECMVLLTYLKDADLKIRFVAIQAIESVVKAYPSGMSIENVTDTASKGHRKMVRRFVERIQKLHV